MLTIINSAGRELPYVRILSHDLILLFEVGPGANVEFAVPRLYGYLSVTAPGSAWVGALSTSRTLSLDPARSEKIVAEITKNGITLAVVPSPRPR